MIVTRTPLRISLCGGGTDMEEFYRHHPGAVISFSINKYVYVMVNNKFDDLIRVSYSKTENVKEVKEIQHDLVRETLRAFKIENGIEIVSVADIHGNGTGLGSSSAFMVGLVNSLGVRHDPKTLAQRSWYVENKLCQRPVGKQDHFASAYGGLNYMEFYVDDVRVRHIPVSIEWKNNFISHSLLLYTGIARGSGKILSQQKNSFADGSNIEIGKEMAKLTAQFYSKIDCAYFDPNLISHYLNESWRIKKFFSVHVSDDSIEKLYTTALENGAMGGKLLGAGGGGFLFFMAPPDTHKKIIEKTGLRKIDFNFDEEGSKVVYG